MAGRPKGTTDPNARNERVTIPLSAAEKSELESIARQIAAKREQPGLGVSTVMREFLLSSMRDYAKLFLGSEAGKSGVGMTSDHDSVTLNCE